MIKSNELRVGNLVEKDGEQYIADFITIQMAHNYNPIPLAPEILEKCGFEIEGLQCNYTKEGFDLTKYPGGYRFVLHGVPAGSHLLYVHQLQNLYYSLTGIDLDVKL